MKIPSAIFLGALPIKTFFLNNTKTIQATADNMGLDSS